MKRSVILLTAIFALIQLCCNTTWARPITVHEARQAATGWLRVDPEPLETVLGGQVAKVETFNDKNGEPIYYVVYLEPAGFVIVPADDLVEPIVGFADDGKYDPSPDNPLGALVNNDLNGRITMVRNIKSLEAHDRMQEALKSQAKWGRLVKLADSDEEEVVIEGLGSISDVRRAPLVQSRWGQTLICLSNGYNYYTPNHYPCGCVATAMAQIMRYHQHPTGGIGVHEFTIKVNDVNQTASTLGGDGSGGTYRWDKMVLDPDCLTMPDEREAIGALCYDAGVSVNMKYTSGGSSAYADTPKYALTSIFQYHCAIVGYEYSGIGISPGLLEMINPNLDANSPVQLGINGSGGAHAVVCDGYGYHSSTMYHHINMGWSGSDDAWYNLPNIDSSSDYNSVHACIYNIRATGVGDGEVISGRVLYANGDPIPNATVYIGNDPPPPPPPPPTSMIGLELQSDSFPVITSTDSKGIYAFSDLNSNTTYYVTSSLRGYVPLTQAVTLGRSQDNHATSGNVWGVDLVPTRLDCLYVDDDAPGDPGPGDPTVSDPLEDGSIQHPFDSIQEAIDEAINDNEIEVAAGTYYEAINFNGKPIRLYSSGGPAVTTINGTGNYHVVQCVSLEHTNTILEGFTITGGNANGVGWPDKYGGGMYNQQSSPTVTNCIFTGNSANFGGGMYNNNNSSPAVTNCIFTGNSTTWGGGGMYNYENSNPTVTDCNFTGNSSLRAGGMYNEQSSPTVTNCVFFDNEASGDTSDMGGGGMRNLDNSNPTISNCTFSNNKATNSGGGGMDNRISSNPTVTNCTFSNNSAGWGSGMFNDNSSSPKVTNCTFSSNSAIGIGGGVYNLNNSSPTVTNCTFSGNSAGTDGGGMDNRVSSNPKVTNCTFSGNSSDRYGGGMDNYQSNPTVKNCILWGDTPDEIYDDALSTTTARYSDVEGGWPGMGNIVADPCFMDANNPDPNLCDLRLKPDSPCIDAADSTALLAPQVITDLDGKARHFDVASVTDSGFGPLEFLDMGAYEFHCNYTAGDSNCDGVVDFRDLAILCANWLAGTEPEL